MYDYICPIFNITHMYDILLIYLVIKDMVGTLCEDKGLLKSTSPYTLAVPSYNNPFHPHGRYFVSQ